MSYELVGKLHKKYETENKTDSFKAREFVVEMDSGSYPQFIKLQLVQDRCALIDDYNEGEQMKVHFDLRGREWQGRYFTNLNAWRVEKVEEGPASQDSGFAPENFPSADSEPPVQADDDLPF